MFFSLQRPSAGRLIEKAISHCVRTVTTWCVLAAGVALAQTPSAPPIASGDITRVNAAPSGARPKIGLALSGGGARGLAHVGVLKELEAARIPVDFVAGTSMGAIVGGLYASGMSAAELERRVRAMNWAQMFADRPPRDQLSLRRKADDLRLSLPLEFGMRDGELRAPRAAVGSSALETTLKALTDGLPSNAEFDQLPIPFRAVATDLVNGEAVVFSRGELASVMRASMSVPAAFAPVEIDGRLLVDGGLVDNLPVDVVRRMGADIVIAVNIGSPLLPREELGSILGIGMQMLNILTEQNVRASIASLKAGDVLVVPDLSKITSVDFALSHDAIARGSEAARGVLPLLTDYALSESDYRRHLVAQRNHVLPSRIDEVRVEGNRYASAEAVRAQLALEPGHPFSPRDVERDLAWLAGRGDFERLDYRVVTERDRNVLLVQVQEKSWGPNYFRFGLNLGTDFRGLGEFNFVANHTRRWLNSFGAEWRNELQIGRTQRLSTELYQPLTRAETLFLSLGAETERRVADVSVRLPDGSVPHPIAQFSTLNSKVALDLGAAFGRYGEFRLGPVYERNTISPRIGDPTLVGVKSNDSGLHASVVFDQRDSATFARSGYRIDASLLRSLTAFGATRTASRVQWLSEYAHTFGDNTIDVALKYGGQFGAGEAPYPYFELGGFLQLSGLRPAELRGEQVYLARAMGFRKIGNLPAFGRGIYLGGSFEAGRVESPNTVLAQARSVLAGSLFLGLDTALGPFYIGYGQASGARRSGYLYLGRP
ncbi:MAG: patatin-like phospholipase family protein [Burkholderiales bacterium]|nr:patatin-like phospholipase family protein [Burkholderiales bacterium]